MMGYLLDENDFKVTPAISRGISMFEITENVNLAPYQIVKEDEEGRITISIQFDPGVNNFNLPIENTATYEEIFIENINSYTMLLNGLPVTIPFDVSIGDTLAISIIKSDVLSSGYMTIKGAL